MAAQLILCVAFFIALLAVLGVHMPGPWDFNPAGAAASQLQVLSCQQCTTSPLDAAS